MKLFETPEGPMTFWKDSSGRIRIAAGDADCVRAFLRRRKDQSIWSVFGSPDQRQEIFLAVSGPVPVASLDELSLGGIKLLPEHCRWEEIDREGLDLFADDSGDIELRLPG